MLNRIIFVKKKKIMRIINLLQDFLGFNEYYKTPRIGGQSTIISGKPEFLDPNNWNDYNIFITTPQLYAVITRLGNLLAVGQWKHYKADKSGKPQLIENSKYVQLLENPNPLLKGNDLIKQWNENRCIYGNNYEYVLRPYSTSIPVGLTNLPPAQVKIKTTGKYFKQTKLDEIIEYYELLNGVVGEKIMPSEINHTRISNSINPIIGQSPMKALFMPISNIRASYQFRNVIMTKHGALGILSNDSDSDMGAIPFKQEERDRINNQYQQSYGIGDEQNKIIMTSAKLKWQKMGFATKDMMLFEEVDADFRTIIDAYGLNDNLFSREKGSTFSNMEEGIKQAYQSTVIPLAEELAMNRARLLNLPSNEWLELDYSHIPALQFNEKEHAEVRKIKADALTTLIATGMYSADELKGIINFD